MESTNKLNIGFIGHEPPKLFFKESTIQSYVSSFEYVLIPYCRLLLTTLQSKSSKEIIVHSGGQSGLSLGIAYAAYLENIEYWLHYPESMKILKEYNEFSSIVYKNAKILFKLQGHNIYGKMLYTLRTKNLLKWSNLFYVFSDGSFSESQNSISLSKELNIPIKTMWNHWRNYYLKNYIPF